MTSDLARHPSSVSIVIPAHNVAATLAATLRSAIDQTVLPLEIIVVDDGSTDETATVLNEFGTAVTTIRQNNGGLAQARRTGTSAAKGDLIALLDADDLCTPDRLATQIAYMNTHPDVLLCAADFSAFDERGTLAASFASTNYDAIARLPRGVYDIFPTHETLPVPGDTAATESHPVSTCRGMVYEKLAQGNFLHPPTVMFRRNVLDLVGNFDPQARSMCDWDWFVQVSRAGQIGYIDRPLLHYRISATQMSSERYWFRRATDTLHIFQRICGRDREICRRYKRAFEKKFGSCCLDAADAVSGEKGTDSLVWLVRSVFRHRYLTTQSFRVLVKALLPSWLLGVARRVRAAIKTA
jgi:glycosyltransferase involved in cell wall biosynthesis